MTRWSDEENCISLPTLYMRKVDDVRRTLGEMRGDNVRTEEFGEYLRPVIRLCKKSVNSRIGAVDYFIQHHDFKHIAVDHYDIEFAVRQLRENVDQLESLTEKLAQIDPEREKAFRTSRDVGSTVVNICDVWEKGECEIDEFISEICLALANMADAIDLIDLTLLKASVFTYKDYINHYND